MLDIENTYKSKLDEIWKQRPTGKIFDRGYCLESSLPEKSILFLGMNPSFDPDKSDFGSHFYPLDNTNKNDSTYWSKLIKTCEILNEPLSHHDLFFVREKKQSFIETNYNSNVCKQFFDKQLELTEEIVAKSNPKMIVVINAAASRIIKEKRLWSFEPIKFWDETLGVDLLGINGTKTPIIFTSMLSGQRAMDNGTYWSLLWHIRHVLRYESLYR